MADAGESYREGGSEKSPDYDSTDFYNRALTGSHPGAYTHEGVDLLRREMSISAGNFTDSMYNAQRAAEGIRQYK